MTKGHGYSRRRRYKFLNKDTVTDVTLFLSHHSFWPTNVKALILYVKARKR